VSTFQRRFIFTSYRFYPDLDDSYDLDSDDIHAATYRARGYRNFPTNRPSSTAAIIPIMHDNSIIALASTAFGNLEVPMAAWGRERTETLSPLLQIIAPKLATWKLDN
jgi:hypothetical protein